MELFCRELPSGRFGQHFEPGLVDRLLEAAMTTNDCVQAVVVAIAAEDRALQDLEEAKVAGERGYSTGVRKASASERYGAAIVQYEELVRVWARQALHLARCAAAALRSVEADPAAVVTVAQVGFGEILPVSRLYADLRLLPAPVNADGDDGAIELRAEHGSAPDDPAATPYGRGDDDPAGELRAAYRRVVDTVRMGAEHNDNVRIVDAVVDPEAKQSVSDAYLRDVAGALHDYGAFALWRVAVLTGPRYGE